MSFWSRQSWFGLFSPGYGVARVRRRQAGRLATLEHLESREMLTSFVVTSADSSYDEGTLPWAIQAANATSGADTITFDSSFNSPQTITLGSAGLPALTGPTIISGPGADLLTVSGNSQRRVFQIADGAVVVIDGMTIADGVADYAQDFTTYGNGGGIYNAGQLSLSNVTLTRNAAASDGGAIFNSGILTITDSTIIQCSATDGGALCSFGILIADRVQFLNNMAESGGAIATYGTSSLSYCIIDSNVAAGGSGGGIYQGGGETSVMTISNSTLSNNSSDWHGGGLMNHGQVTIASSSITGNTAVAGGGISSEDRLRLANSTVSGNSAESAGAIENQASMDISSSTISANTASVNAAGIWQNPLSSPVVLLNTIVAGNLLNGVADNVAGQINMDQSRNNLLGPGSEGFEFSSSNGNRYVDADAFIGLGPLGDYGGVTQTMPLLDGSPAIDAGILYAPSGVGSYDQRGEGFSRLVGTQIDIGAVESNFAHGYASVDEMETLADYVDLFGLLYYPFTYTISGGEDQDLFAINPSTGVLTFVTAPDYEHPQDANSDNVYQLELTVTDSNLQTAVVPWTVYVVDVFETPDSEQTLALNSEAATYQIGGSPVRDSTAVFEAGQDDLDYAGAQLVVSITSNRDAKDLLKIVSQGTGSGQISIKRKNVLFGGVVIGTFQGGTKASPNLVITFNSSATESAVNALVKQVSFSTKNRKSPQPARTLQMDIVGLFGWEQPAATRQINIIGRS